MRNLPLRVAAGGVTREIWAEEVYNNVQEKRGAFKEEDSSLLLDNSVKVSSFLKEEDRESERERESRFYKALTGVHDAT